MNQDIINFYKEIERGCIYQVKSNHAHRSTFSGIIEAPYLEERLGGVLTYKTVPIHLLKKRSFYIKKGELGNLVDVGFLEEKITFLD